MHCGHGENNPYSYRSATIRTNGTIVALDKSWVQSSNFQAHVASLLVINNNDE